MISPGLYRHYKGPEYEVLDICLHTETEEPMVYYKAVGKTQTFVRPYDMFVGTVEIKGQVMPRFKRVG